jgi:hypothetical protein
MCLSYDVLPQYSQITPPVQDNHSSQTNLSLKNMYVPSPSNPSMFAIWQPLFYLTQNIIQFLWQPNTLSFNLNCQSVPIWFCYLVLYAWCTAFFSHTSFHRVVYNVVLHAQHWTTSSAWAYTSHGTYVWLTHALTHTKGCESSWTF